MPPKAIVCGALDAVVAAPGDLPGCGAGAGRGAGVARGRSDTPGPTIDEVLSQFLDAQAERLAHRTFLQYRGVVQLLQMYLNAYAGSYLSGRDLRRFNALYDSKGAAHREFCEIFGPDHILSNVSEFLGYYLVRKAAAGEDLLRQAATVTKRLAGWLVANGHIGAEAAETAVDTATSAGHTLPKLERLAQRLRAHAAASARGIPTAEGIQDHFTLTRVEPGQVWVTAVAGGTDHGPIALPEEATGELRSGMVISGVLVPRRGGWRWAEVWNVYRD